MGSSCAREGSRRRRGDRRCGEGDSTSLREGWRRDGGGSSRAGERWRREFRRSSRDFEGSTWVCDGSDHGGGRSDDRGGGGDHDFHGSSHLRGGSDHDFHGSDHGGGESNWGGAARSWRRRDRRREFAGRGEPAASSPDPSSRTRVLGRTCSGGSPTPYGATADAHVQFRISGMSSRLARTYARCSASFRSHARVSSRALSGGRRVRRMASIAMS